MDNEDYNFNSHVVRIFQLSNFCIANIAAYRVNWEFQGDKKVPRVKSDFWIRSNGALFDMAVIDWCKLFADRRSKHHWSVLFPKKNEWLTKLTEQIQMSESAYEAELIKIKAYRDKVAAHLDDPTPMNYPLTEIMLQSASFLYDQITQSESTKILIGPIYDSASDLYDRLVLEYEQEIILRLKNL